MGWRRGCRADAGDARRDRRRRQRRIRTLLRRRPAGSHRGRHRRLVPAVRARLRADARDRARRPAAAAALRRGDPHVARRLPGEPATDRPAQRRAGAVHHGRRRGAAARGVADRAGQPAFALGAVVAPPDAVAATTIARRVGLPRRIVTILEGESLVNDATAIVALRVSIAAAGGTVTVWEVGLGFIVSAVGGVVVGALVALVVGKIRRRIDDTLTDVAFSLLTPWLAYLPAEEIHLPGLDTHPSGVLAVVVAGLLLGHKSHLIQSASSRHVRAHELGDDLLRAGERRLPADRPADPRHRERPRRRRAVARSGHGGQWPGAGRRHRAAHDLDVPGDLSAETDSCGAPGRSLAAVAVPRGDRLDRHAWRGHPGGGVPACRRRPRTVLRWS